MIVHDAAVAFVAVIRAALLWVQVLAGFAAMVLCALPLCIAPSMRAFRGRRGAQAGRGAPQTTSRDSRIATTPERAADGRRSPRVPSWAHTDHHDYREAA